MQTIHRIAAGAALVALGAVALGACGGDDGKGAARGASSDTGPITSRPVIAVTGHGKAEGTPDLMTITLGVETRGATAAAALADNNERANRLIAVLHDKGVEKKDLQTSNLSVYPMFDQKGQRITGYTVNNTLTARVRGLDNAGPIIDAAAFATGDAIRFDGVSFSIDDTSEVIAQARQDAVKRAIDQARQLARASGTKLGKIRSIDETNRETTPVVYPQAFAADMARSAQAGAPIEPGSQELTVDVTVVFDIA
jgi:uncharacterized protein YggE